MYIRWRDKVNGISWYLRDLDTDGVFYGDVTDTNRFQQRNFRGRVLDHQREKCLHYCELLTSSYSDDVAETKDPLFIASIGEKLNQVKFRGAWLSRLDIPVQMRELLDLVHSFIPPSLVLLPDEDPRDWKMSS